MSTEATVRRRVKGLSEAAFRERFGTEAQCRQSLLELRWHDGLSCPSCGGGAFAS